MDEVIPRLSVSFSDIVVCENGPEHKPRCYRERSMIPQYLRVQRRCRGSWPFNLIPSAVHFNLHHVITEGIRYEQNKYISPGPTVRFQGQGSVLTALFS